MRDIEKTENKVPVLERICIRQHKGGPVLHIDSCELNREIGISEDFRGGSTARQVSMLSAEAEEAMEKDGRQGLCMKKFMGNLITRNLDYCSLKAGMRLQFGDAVLEITQVGKECFGECILVQNNSICPLVNSCAFGRVIQDGKISPGIRIERKV